MIDVLHRSLAASRLSESASDEDSSKLIRQALGDDTLVLLFVRRAPDLWFRTALAWMASDARCVLVW
jgi:hypothetical protein